MVLAVGIWEHLKPGQFGMIHGTTAELKDGSKCAHATDKVNHMDYWAPDLPPHGSLVGDTKGRESK